MKADSVFDLPFVAEQPQGCHNIDLRLLAQARLAYEAQTVLKNFVATPTSKWRGGERRARLEYL
jgi:hypothetical protein